MDPRVLSGLAPVMALTRGEPGVAIALLDGPVVTADPALSSVRIRALGGGSGVCVNRDNSACAHATLIAKLLFAQDGEEALGVCPGCTLLVRPIFEEAVPGGEADAAPEELANAIVESVDAGARVINISSAFGRPSTRGERRLEQAIEHAARRGVIIVAAAGNQATLGSSSITRHPWVIPVSACDAAGRPAAYSNLGASIARRGLLAPGEALEGMGDRALAASGTSLAVPYVTGAVALLWSLHPAASSADVRSAVTRAPLRRRSVIPPLLDARASNDLLVRSSANLRSHA